MALTVKAEQKLKAAGLIEYFEKNRAAWLQVAKQTYQFVRGNFPAGAVIHPDDVAEPLRAIVEVDENLRKKLDADRLSQQYWITFFTDLIVDRTWTEIATARKP